MNYTDALAELFQSGVDSLWRSVGSMPAEKLEWRPAPDARTPHELLHELISTTAYSTVLIKTLKNADMADSADGEGPADLAELEKQHRAAVQEFLEAIKAFPEDKFGEEIALPWGTMSFLKVIDYPYWNMMYHWGQINYIQTMYGDKQMP